MLVQTQQIKSKRTFKQVITPISLPLPLTFYTSTVKLPFANPASTILLSSALSPDSSASASNLLPTNTSSNSPSSLLNPLTKANTSRIVSVFKNRRTNGRPPSGNRNWIRVVCGDWGGSGVSEGAIEWNNEGDLSVAEGVVAGIVGSSATGR